MSRRPRYPVTDLPFHVVQRGNDRQPCFFADRDYAFYLKALYEASVRCRVLVHAYALMTNHVHLLMTPLVVGGIARVMQSVGARYVGYVNASLKRTGTLWEGRYHACIVETDQHVLAACRYIDLNPVRAGIARDPSAYRWSSFLALCNLRFDRLVTPHDALEQLGLPRGPAYAKWCAEGDRATDLARLREATARELAFGSEAFRSRIEAVTARAAFADRQWRLRDR